MLHAPFKIAEALKVRYGHLCRSAGARRHCAGQSFRRPGSNQRATRSFLAEVLEARAEEILESLLREVKRSGYDGLLLVALC